MNDVGGGAAVSTIFRGPLKFLLIRNVFKHVKACPHQYLACDDDVNLLQVWSENDVTPDARPRRQGRAKAGQGATDLSQSLKENLKRLKNVLKLPKARRWVYCEFFYSGVDQQLFLGDNEFSQCLRESFPNLKCRNLSRAEWRTIRRLIGKPRRCSQVRLY